LSAAIDFYRTKLGFNLSFSYGEPPFYAQVQRDGASLNLRLAPNLARSREAHTGEEDILAATLILDDAKPLFLEFQAAGVQFAQPLRSEPWGARTFIVEDLDGNLLCFAGRGD